VSPDTKHVDGVRRRLRDVLRQLYFMAPDHGAAIVHEILSTPDLRQMWQRELDQIRGQVTGMRSALRRTLEDANPGFDAAFLERQRGMFSCLPVSAAEQLTMEREFHIYMLPHARVNVAAMNAGQSATLAEAFAFVRAERASGAHQAFA
jgi:aspartate/tyrosine/aromatic aminotransferase